nr:hypothetical protein [uncultured Clostridium sp.]
MKIALVNGIKMTKRLNYYFIMVSICSVLLFMGDGKPEFRGNFNIS